MEYELVKRISIKALEEAGACERELHRFAFLTIKAGYILGYTDEYHIDTVIKIASQCEGGIDFLKAKGFIREKEPELKKCAHCGGEAKALCLDPGYYVQCSWCRTRTDYMEQKESSIKAWNTRV